MRCIRTSAGGERLDSRFDVTVSTLAQRVANLGRSSPVWLGAVMGDPYPGESLTQQRGANEG